MRPILEIGPDHLGRRQPAEDAFGDRAAQGEDADHGHLAHKD